MRSSFVGSAIQASVFDVTDGDLNFIGIVSDGTKIAYEIDAGHHVFMVVSEAADFMEGDLAAGLTYYGTVTPRMGAWKARFCLWPVRNGTPGECDVNSDKFQNWLQKTEFVVNTAESEQWFADNIASISEKHDKYWTACPNIGSTRLTFFKIKTKGESEWPKVSKFIRNREPSARRFLGST